MQQNEKTLKAKSSPGVEREVIELFCIKINEYCNIFS